MEWLLSLFSGRVRVAVTCLYPERFMNICAESGIAFSDLEYTDGSVILVTVSLKDYKRLKRLFGGRFAMSAVRKTGTPFLLYGIRKRYALIIGMAVCFFAVWIMSMFIWQIEVTGNEKVSTSRILAELDDLGVRVGTCSFNVSQDYISNEMLLRVPELCWIAVNVNGSRAEVKVREAVKPPEMADSSTPTLIYASKGGLITGVTVLEGQTECAVGQTVSAGDVLATGIVESRLGGHRTVHAKARVTARTWYNTEAVTPAERSEKEYTGEKKTKTTIILADKRIKLYIDSGISWSHYDKITERRQLKLFGAVLPISVEKTTAYEYEIKTSRADDSAELEEYLLNSVESRLNDGEILSASFEHGEGDGVLRARISAECREQIAASRELTEEELGAVGLEQST